MLLHEFTDTLKTCDIETRFYLSDDYAHVTISQSLHRGGDVISFNEVSLPLHDFAACATSASREYVANFLDNYKIEP
jgi:hypothetical protein